jgi:hypothetical protein
VAGVILDAEDAICDPSPTMEITMRMKIIAALSFSLIAALAGQAAPASERHHTRPNARTVANERLRNSNAYYAAPSDTPAPSYWSSVDEGAMSSGPAGH